MVYRLGMFLTIHVSCFRGLFHTWDCSCEHSQGCTRTYVHTWDCSCNIHQDVLVLLGVVDVHQCNKVNFPYLLFLCAFLWLPFIPFPLSPTLLGMKDLLFILLGFPRYASMRDRSPESSEPHVTLDSRSSLIRTTFGVHASFFPGSHLRVSRTPQIFKVTWRILSHRYAVPRDETTCACFHFQRELSEELSWYLFIETNSCAKL